MVVLGNHQASIGNYLGPFVTFLHAGVSLSGIVVRLSTLPGLELSPRYLRSTSASDWTRKCFGIMAKHSMISSRASCTASSMKTSACRRSFVVV